MNFKGIVGVMILFVTFNSFSSQTSFPVSSNSATYFTSEGCTENGISSAVAVVDFYYPRLLCNERIFAAEMKHDNDFFVEFNDNPVDTYTSLFKHLIIRDRMGYIADYTQRESARGTSLDAQMVTAVQEQVDTITGNYLKPLIAVQSTLVSEGVDRWIAGDIKNIIEAYALAEGNKSAWLAADTSRVLSDYPNLSTYNAALSAYEELDGTIKTSLTEITKVYGADRSIRNLLSHLNVKKLKTSQQLIDKLKKSDAFWDSALDEALSNLSDNDVLQKLSQNGVEYDGFKAQIESLKTQVKELNNQIKQLESSDTDSAKEQLLLKIKSHVKNLKTGDIANKNARRLKKIAERMGPALQGLVLASKFAFIVFDQQESNYLIKREHLQELQRSFSNQEITAAINQTLSYLDEIQGVSWSDSSGFSYITDNAGAIKTKVFDHIAEDVYGNVLKGSASIIFDIATPLASSFGMISQAVNSKLSLFGFALNTTFKIYEIFASDDQFIKTGARSVAAHRLAYLMWQHSQTQEGAQQVQSELLSHLFINYGYDQFYNAYYWMPGLNLGTSTWGVRVFVYGSLLSSAASGAEVAGWAGAIGAASLDLAHKYTSVYSILLQGMDKESTFDTYQDDYQKHSAAFNLLRAQQIDKASGIVHPSPQLNLQSLPVIVKEVNNGEYLALHIASKDLFQQISFLATGTNSSEYFGIGVSGNDLKQNKYRQVSASILHNQSNVNVNLDTVENRDTTLSQIDIVYYENSCDALNNCEFKYRHPDGKQPYRTSKPLTDIILYIKKSDFNNVSERKVTLFDDLRLQLKLRNANGSGFISEEIPLAELVQNSVAEKTITPSSLDVDSVLKYNLDSQTGTPLVGLHLSNALPDKNSPNNIKVGHRTKPWSIIRINPLHPTVVELYYGINASDYNATRVSTITGLNHLGEQALTHNLLQLVANNQLSAQVYAVYDSYIGNFSNFIGSSLNGYRSDLTEYAGKGSVKDYVMQQIVKSYVAQSQSFRESDVTYAIEEDLSGFLNVNTYGDDGRLVDYIMEITLPEGEGRDVNIPNGTQLYSPKYTFTAQANDQISLRYLLGTDVEAAKAQCWYQPYLYEGDSLEQSFIVLINDDTGEEATVDFSISDDCADLIFTLPESGTWQLKQYGYSYISATDPTKTVTENASFSATHNIVAGDPSRFGGNEQPNSSVAFIMPCRDCGNPGPYDRDWLGDNTDHLGKDYPAFVGDNVVAIADGEVYQIWTNISGFGGSNPSQPGGAIVIQHTKSNGDKFFALYGHVNNTTSLLVNDTIAAGQVIGTVGNYWVGTESGTENWPHLHFGIWDSSISFPTTKLGYGSVREFVDPVLFLKNETAIGNDGNNNGEPVLTATHPLNDTGITTCSNTMVDGLPCPLEGFEGQDAEYGRDVLAAAGQLQKVGAGPASFDLTKLDVNGNDLPPSATEWSCVRDNHTNLIWEVKTDDGGTRDRNNTYMWYSSDSSTNGGDAGYGEEGGSCPEVGQCNTEKYIERVNQANLCGIRHWRLPTRNEYLSLVDYSQGIPAKIPSEYFIEPTIVRYLVRDPVDVELAQEIDGQADWHIILYNSAYWGPFSYIKWEEKVRLVSDIPGLNESGSSLLEVRGKK